MNNLIKFEKQTEVTIHTVLRRLRERKGVSQGKLGKLLGYSSPQFISNWERGIALPPAKTIRELANIFNCDVNELEELYVTAILEKTEEEIRTEFRSASSQKKPKKAA